jgi:hypothetical protein
MALVQSLEIEARAVAALAFLVQQVRAGDFRDPLGRRARDLLACMSAEDLLIEIGVDPDEARPA